MKWPNSPSGLPGVQTTLYLMLHHISKNKISLEKVIELLSYNPAKIYNIKNKGQLKKGYDADITIIDLNKNYTIKNQDMVKAKYLELMQTAKNHLKLDQQFY